MKRCDAFDGQQVRADACNACTHLAKHAAKLLDVGFAGSIVDGRNALSQHSRHDDVCRASHRGFVQEHIGAFESFSLHVIEM